MKPTLVLDIECYPNFFLIGFRNVVTGNTKMFTCYGEEARLQPDEVAFCRKVVQTHRLITFNGRNYDFPMMFYALSGATCRQLKECSDKIILEQKKFWDIERIYNIHIPRAEDGDVDHWDLIDVAFGKASLKIYGGRIHSKTMWDLPFDPGKTLLESDVEMLVDYWQNDLQTTVDLYNELEPELKLREQMTAEYGIDLMSKSDAQIAEAIIRKGVEDKLGRKVYRPTGREGDWFNYVAPPWIQFHTPQLRQILEVCTTTKFIVDDKGSVLLPSDLEGLTVGLGSSAYRMGIGGLHSSEEKVAHHADDNYCLLDRDVTSYYPSIILGLGLYPEHLGKDFLDVYRGIYERRLSAKAAGDKVVADTLKIVLNGSFGKFGSKWSVLYSPELMIQVTLTGQLALLMLIEMIEHADLYAEVISGNTDGIVIKCFRPNMEELAEVVAAWEKITGFNTEETEYRSLYSRDVNNYIAVKLDGTTKTKGAFSFDGLHKNPSNMICNDAVIDYILHGTPVEQTVMNCFDVRRFVTIRQVKGGGVTDEGEYLGKAVRWYYSDQSEEWVSASCIRYLTNGNLVAGSTGATPLMTLPLSIPKDLDYTWYIDNAKQILADIGAV